MNWQTHAEMVSALRKSGYDVLIHLTGQRVDLWHAVTGVVTEAGELMDAVKKLVIYNKDIDMPNILEELGDIEFYLEQVRQNLGMTREEILAHNMEKLERRYGSSYTDAAAQKRADKA